MVSRPNPLTITTPRGLKLSAMHYPANSDAMIVFSHGFCGDKASNGRFKRIAMALQGIGFDCLAYDFAGCGQSDDEALSLGAQVEDLGAVLDFVRSQGFVRLGLYGHSLGGMISMRNWADDIRTMVLSGPVTGTCEFDWAVFFDAEQLAAMDAGSAGIHRPEEGPREQILIDGNMILDFKAIDQGKVMRHVQCPVLIVHGDVGEDEHILCATAREGMQYLSPASRLEIIPGADHTFMDHLQVLIDMMVAWYPRFM